MIDQSWLSNHDWSWFRKKYDLYWPLPRENLLVLGILINFKISKTILKNLVSKFWSIFLFFLVQPIILDTWFFLMIPHEYLSMKMLFKQLWKSYFDCYIVFSANWPSGRTVQRLFNHSHYLNQYPLDMFQLITASHTTTVTKVS